MSSRRYSMQSIPADLDSCSTQNVISHLIQLTKIDGSETRDDSGICRPDIAQFIFDLAHKFGQPSSVKIHAVNLLEDLVKKGAAIYRMTLPLTICIAAKLNLSYNRIPLTKIQALLKEIGWGECSTSKLLIHEQQILVTLEFDVESRTVLQLVETLLTVVHRLEPLEGARVLLETAGHLCCLYVLYRIFMPYHLKHSRRHAACALALASKMVRDESSHTFRNANPNFLKILSRVMLLQEDRITTDAGLLLNIILKKDKQYFEDLHLPSEEGSDPPARVRTNK